MNKKRKRPRGAEPRTRRRSVNVTPTLDRAIERHAVAQGLGWGNIANQMLTEQMEAIRGRNKTEKLARELLAWYDSIPESLQSITWGFGQIAAGVPTARLTQGPKGGKK